MSKNKKDRAWDLLDAIGESDEGFVADADKVPKRNFAPILFLKRHKPSPRAMGVIAACLVLAIALPVFAVLMPWGGGGTVSQGGDGAGSNVLEVSKGEASHHTSADESETSSGTSDAASSGEPSGDDSSEPVTSRPETSEYPNDPPRPPLVFASAPNLMEGIVPAKVEAKQADEAFLKEQMRFSLALFQQAAKGEKAEGNSLLLSPLSAQFALAMTANGARGRTRQEMLSLLAGELSMEQLNGYLHTLRERLTESGDGYKVNVANGIWYNEGLQVYKEFLQTNADYYGAGAYQALFDEETRAAINAWVSEQTDGMIPEALDKIDSDAAMYLLNAILFDAEWQAIYFESDISKDTFRTYSGETLQVSFMKSREKIYYEDAFATGFAKSYTGGKYAFVAMLPNEGVDVYDYVASLTPEGLLHTLQNGKREDVMTALPKFSSAYRSDMKDLLTELGMGSAFDETVADFSGMIAGFDGDGHLESVSQKTVISVGELGTKASSVTVSITGPDSYPNYSVFLDRPFVYMIVDTETNLPLFMGVQTEIDDSGVPEGEAPEISSGLLPPEPEPEPEPPSYEGKDFTGLTVRLRGAFVTADDDDLLSFLLENGSETMYEYMNTDVVLQKKTETGWKTIPHYSDEYGPVPVLYQVPAGETGTASISAKYFYKIEFAAGETYRVIFPGVEGLQCEFTVIGRENSTTDASELHLQLDGTPYPGLQSVYFRLTNNSDLPFVYSYSDVLLERKTADGWETFSLLEPDDWEVYNLSGEELVVGILAWEYGVKFQSGETYRIVFRNVPGLYEEFQIP